MKIAISGKGGVGKTLIAGALAIFLAERGFKVLAIDADPSPNLALTLGVPLEQANEIVPVSENRELIESKTRTDFPGVYRLSFSVDDIVKDFCVETPFNVDLMVMGSVKSAGGGCTCPANAVIRALLQHLFVERDEAVVVDMEAGVEHLGRGTARHVNVMLIVTDSSFKSMETARKIHGLASDLGIKNLFLVGNKVKDNKEAELIKKFSIRCNIPLIGLVPYDERIFEADMMGETPLRTARNSSGLLAIKEICERLIELNL